MRKFKNWHCVAALTGGVGCGKSTALAYFKKKGAFVVDADRIVHHILKHDKRVREKIKKEFGVAVELPSGAIDRRKLADRVFGDVRARMALERIIHPIVREKIVNALNKNSGRVAVCDIPLLFETRQHRRYDVTIVVNASLARRKNRLLKKGVSKSDIRRRLKAQMPLRLKVKKADFVINNNDTKKKMEKYIDQIWSQLI